MESEAPLTFLMSMSERFGENLIEWIVILLYFILLLGMGWAFGRINKDTSDYFRSGCRGTWWLVGTSTFIAGISAKTFTANSGVAYEAGLSVFVIYGAVFISFLIQAAFSAPIFRQLRVTTFPEIIAARFNMGSHQFIAYHTLIITFFQAGVWLWGLAILVATVFNFPLTGTIIVLGLVVMFYSAIGGSWAVMATDFVQSLVLLPMIILISFLCLREVGGVEALYSKMHLLNEGGRFDLIKGPESGFPNGKYTLYWSMALAFIHIMESFSMMVAPKYFGVKDGWEARKAALLSSLLYVFGSLFFFVPAFTAAVLWSTEVDMLTNLSKPAEAAYSLAALKVLPVGMIGMMVVAMFAATMSSMDTGLNRNAAIVIKDIYPSLCRLLGKPVRSERDQLILAKYVTVVLGILVIGVALYFSRISGMGMFEVILEFTALFVTPILVPVVFGLYMKSPRWSLVSTLAIGFLFGIALKIGFNPLWHWQIFLMIGVCFIAFILTRPFYSNEPEAERGKVEQFLANSKTPIDFQTEVGEANDQVQFSITGIFSTAAGLFVLCLMGLPNSGFHRLCILAVGLFITLVGMLMILLGKRAGRQQRVQSRTKTLNNHSG